jgi:protoheme IX farnesyltransferase
MWFDHDIDAGMRRTNTRPVPMGWISRVHALVFGIIIATLGTIVLWQVHWKAGFWTGFSVLFYVLIYTIWLKRRSPYNIVIGGIAGATPPLIAWAAAASTTLSGSNPLDLGSPVPWMLFLLIFLWTPPHFWALALYRHGEYGKVGVPMMPDAKGPHRTLLESKIYCVLLILLAAIPIIWSDYGIGWPLSVVVAGLGIWYASTVWAIDADEALDENQRMPKAFHSFMASLKYLALMFFGVVIVAAQPWL